MNTLLPGLKNISDLVPHCDKELRSFWSDRQSDSNLKNSIISTQTTNVIID